VLLGLLIAPSVSGVLIGVAAFVAFVARTPLKLTLIDARRGRWLDRSRLALTIVVAELAVLAVLGILASMGAGADWLVPVLAASPLIAVEMWFEVRSRGRRLLPELCGAVAISSVAAAIIVAADGSARLAAGAWLVLAARAVATIPFVRLQIARLRRHRGRTLAVDVVQGFAVATAVVTVGIEHRLAAGCAGVAALAVVQSMWVRRPPVQAKVLGLWQLAFGLALVALTATGFWVS
jgi:hypothetical protein